MALQRLFLLDGSFSDALALSIETLNPGILGFSKVAKKISSVGILVLISSNRMYS